MSELTSPLHDRHVALGAKFASFGGWQMPLEYGNGGVLKEHAAVRERVGVFDVSHLGKLMVAGEGAAAYVNATLSADFDKVGAGGAQYTLCCDEGGGVVDDLIAYRYGDSEVGLVPNAANSAEVARRLMESAPEGVTVTDRHRDLAVLAVQGPSSDETLSALGLPAVDDYMRFQVATHDGVPVTVCRTGYTGERGYELIVDSDHAVAVWDGLLAAGAAYGVLPCGLGARDTLRTEMGYPLHGQDVSLDISPVEARLGWAVGWKKPAFWGREALLAQKEAGPARVLRGIVAQGRGIARPGMRVSISAHVPVGTVTSGTFSPTLRRSVGLALIDAQVTDGAEVTVDVRGRREVFVVTKPPFVQPSVR